MVSLRFLTRYPKVAFFNSLGNMVFMKLALSDNDMPNRSPIFQTKCRNEGDVRGVSIFERMGLYKSDCPLAKWSMFSCSISRFSLVRNFAVE